MTSFTQFMTGMTGYDAIPEKVAMHRRSIKRMEKPVRPVIGVITCPGAGPLALVEAAR